MAPRFRKEEAEEDGWSRWINPTMFGYRMACCDCGLVHTMEFKAVRVTAGKGERDYEVEDLSAEEYRVEFRVRRNNRSTAQIRRRKNEA